MLCTSYDKALTRKISSKTVAMLITKCRTYRSLYKLNYLVHTFFSLSFSFVAFPLIVRVPHMTFDFPREVPCVVLKTSYAGIDSCQDGVVELHIL